MELGSTEFTAKQDSYVSGVGAGLVAIAPLLLAVAPFAVAMAVAAHTAGFNALEIVWMSAFVFAGAAQMAAISLYASGAGLITIALTTLLINLRHIIYGLSLDRHLPVDPRPPRPVLAFLLVDESYGLAVAHAPTPPRTDAFYLGASLGLYVTFVLCTGIGAISASLVPGINRAGLELIFPLAFVGLLLPMLKGARQIVIAIVSGTLALGLLQILAPGIGILLAIVGGATTGAVWKEKS